MIAQEAVRHFETRFGGPPEVLAVAPGRINLIGEHTDYNDGFVFPVAIDRVIAVAARVTPGHTELISEQLGLGETFDAGNVEMGAIGGWAKHPAGVAWGLRDLGFEAITNIQAVVHGEVPVASGVSSSAALEVAFGSVWNELDQMGLEPMELAKLAQTAENRYVGVNCGLMDPAASALGRAGHAMFFDTRSLEIRYAPIPERLRIVLCDTGTPRALAESGYNERRHQCELAAKAMGIRSLRDATLELLGEHQDDMDGLAYLRAKHVITENGRCQGFVGALESGNDLRIGTLMRASHESLRDDYEVSTPELDAMAESCWHAPGCIGARMTGAGFGGACVALVNQASVSEFLAFVRRQYRERTGLEGQFDVCQPTDGARIVPLDTLTV
ncbi:MAG TPA: galactokinase [Fimbriimonadaceae bacterium]|nr:galactokinase [Fimbriimonadaceae bacterium]